MERKKNVAEIQRLCRKKREQTAIYNSLVNFLVSKGIQRSIVESITDNLSCDNNELFNLKKSLVQKIRTTGELAFPSVLALVGPTGAGKSTTLIKLAELYSKQGKKVAIVSLDLEKKGAFAQLEHHAKQKNVPIHNSMREARGDLVLIDTSGCNFYQPHRVEELGEQLSTCGQVEILLTLSAATKDVDIYGAIHQFSSLCPSSIAFTKLDETLAGGILINVSSKTDLPIRYISYGYPLPGEIELADPYKIVHKILTDFNQEEFNYIRQLTLSN